MSRDTNCKHIKNKQIVNTQQIDIHNYYMNDDNQIKKRTSNYINYSLPFPMFIVDYYKEKIVLHNAYPL